MALSVTSYEPADWFNSSGTSRTVTGVAWNSGDIIIAIGGTESASHTLTTPTNANLTFSLAASVTTGSSNECTAYVWTATAGSSQTGQTISTTISTSTRMGGLHIWVVTGSPSGTTGAAANQTETAPSLTVAAGDVVCYGLFDWNATTPTKTPLTGSGTATERADTGNGSEYGTWSADWVGTSAGTFSFGPNNYTGLKIAHGYIIVQAPAGGTNANATVASSTATAQSATTKVSPTAGQASATGTAQTPRASVAPSAGSASATATAHNATTTSSGNAAATAASATATAHDASVRISPNAGVASATAAAQAPSVSIAPTATVASATGSAHNATATTADLWEDYTDDFPGSALGSLWNAPYGDTPTVSGNKLTWPTTASTYSGVGSASTHSLIGSYVLVYLNPRTTGGYIGISVKSSGNTDIMAASYRHTAGQLWGDWNGSDWSSSDSQGTVSFSGTDVWLRVREASGTGYMEYSTDGTTWNTIHSVTLSAAALAELDTAKIELNQGPFSSSITSTGSFAKFNLPPTGTNAPATVASATGTANTAQASVAPSAGSAAATGAAQTAQASVAPTAGAASATGAAQTPQAGVSPTAGSASAAAAAHDATASTSGGASPVATVAEATGTANDATAKVSPTATAATATATAHDATTTSASATNAQATVASATASAHDATVKISPNAGVATAVATAQQAVVAATTAPSPVMDVEAITAYVQVRTLREYDAELAVRSYEALAPTLSL